MINETNTYSHHTIWGSFNIIMIVLMILSSMLSSCIDKAKNEKTADADNKGSISIVYFTDRIQSSYLNEACKQFRDLYPDIQLDEMILKGETGLQELDNKIPAEIAAGEGPDIIVSQEGYRSFDIYKAVGEGLFTDLNSLIQQTEGFNIEDYNKVIMDSGVFNKKRFLMPVWYDVPVFCTSKELLEENGISIDLNNISWEELSGIAENYKNGLKQNKAQNLFSGLFSSYFFMESGLTFADYTLKKSFCDSPEFKKLLETYKKLYSATCPAEIQSKNEGNFNLIKENQAVIEYRPFSLGPDHLIFAIEEFKEQTGGNMLIFKPESMFGGKRFIAEIGDLVGINSKCRYKKEAFNFIKLLLSEKFQQKIKELYVANITGISVNEKAYQADTIQAVEKGLNKDIIDRVNNIKQNIEKCYIDTDIDIVIIKEILDYLENKKDIDQVVKVINDKINLYLNE